MSIKEVLARIIDALKVDYITEKGTATGNVTFNGSSDGTVTWQYTKWNSGRVEMHCRYAKSTNVSHSDGGGYRTETVAISIPDGLLGGRPEVFCSIYNGATTSAIITPVGLTSPSATTTGQWAGYRITSVSSNAYKYFEFLVKYL